MTYSDQIVQETIDKLINGKDYRETIINDISAQFLDFTIEFFKKIIDAKIADQEISLEWYKKTFLNIKNYPTDEIAIFAGINKKTITNIASNARQETIIDFSNTNFEYLTSMIDKLDQDSNDHINIEITLSYKSISVKLNLTESLLVINALATKKIALRGSAWSSIGKRVEKPLVDILCKLAQVDSQYIDNSTFVKDSSKNVDREVDYKLKSRKGQTYYIEVKLMGKGNPESADVIHARDTSIFIADTLSKQNKNQFHENKVSFVELKNHSQEVIIKTFKEILKKLDIPHK